MNVCKVGNQTSSQDPHAVNSRIFVGNLNTFQVSKIDVEKIFQRYGRIVGISMHKGYAFVQFANPFDARSACLGEDARNIAGQVLDVNMVSEPKAHLTKGKSQTQKPDSESSETVDEVNGETSSANSRKRMRSESDKEQVKICNSDLSDLKNYGIPDILICGNCKEIFANLHDIIEHKRNYCKLRFTCKCGPPKSNREIASQFSTNGNFDLPNVKSSGSADEATSVSDVALLCSSCHADFSDPFQLMEHVQSQHNIEIFSKDKEDHNNLLSHEI